MSVDPACKKAFEEQMDGVILKHFIRLIADLFEVTLERSPNELCTYSEISLRDIDACL